MRFDAGQQMSRFFKALGSLTLLEQGQAAQRLEKPAHLLARVKTHTLSS